MVLPGAGRRGRGKPELCMTPMIDIVVNLVIFFLLMPSFEATEGYLPTNLPDTDGGDGPSTEQTEPVRIDLGEADSAPGDPAGVCIMLNREPLRGVGELRSALKAAWHRSVALENRPERTPVLIAPGGTVRHNHVVAAFDAAVDAGFERSQFAAPR